MTKETVKKPFYKRWWFWFIIVIVAIGALGSTEDTETMEEDKVEQEEIETEETEKTEENEPEEESEEEVEPADDEVAMAEEENESEVETDEQDTTWDDLKNKDNIVGKSDKDFTELTKKKPTDVRNDKTGNWRKISITDNVDIEEYALSYRDLHMKEDEVHFIINFTRNTTTWLNELGGLLYVDIRERVDGEEHDASTLGNGMVLTSYVIYPDGDIEEIDM